MAISLLGILSNSYVAYSKSIAFYIQRAMDWKTNNYGHFTTNKPTQSITTNYESKEKKIAQGELEK